MRVADLSWPEYAQRVGNHLLALPIGAIEAHGPHLPLATDTIVANYLVERLDTRLDTLILPSIGYGYKTDPIRAGGEFAGATDLGVTTLSDLVLDVLSASYGHGGRRFLLLHGHIANLPVVYDGVARFVRRCPDARVMAASWWDFASEETRNAIARETGVDRDDDNHAAMVETSLVMHMSPASVRRDLITDDGSQRRVRYLVLPAPESLQTRTGVVYRATGASADIGKRLTSEIVDNLVDAVRLELGVADSGSCPRATRPAEPTPRGAEPQ